VPREEAKAPPVPAPERAAVLVDSKGAVELRRGSEPWSQAATGTRLGESDALRTGADGEAQLSVDGVRVKLHDHSEIRLTAASSGLLRARVRGRIESEVEEGKGQVGLQVEDGAVAESSGGHFLLTAEGNTVTVAATRGSVRVAANGKSVDVREGQLTRMAAKGELARPTPALRRVLLAVQWPGDKTNRSSIPLSGRTLPGSRIYVQGQLVQVSPSGEFYADVQLHEGQQKIAVVAVDPFGRRKWDESQITRDQSLPQVRAVASPWLR